MSREAFGDPPEQQAVPECCPNCGSDFYMPGCTHCDEVKQRCAAESEALALRGQLGAASEMVNAGVDLFTVGRVLGHRDPRSTGRYAHLTAESLAAAVAKIGKKRA